MTDPNPGGLCAPWIDEALAKGCEECSDLADTAFTDPINYLTIASEVLYVLSARQWPGECQTTVYPISEDCSTEDPRVIGLGGYPIVEIVSVTIDGDVLPATAYRVDDFRFLRRVDGQSWPSYQEIYVPDPRFSIEFKFGSQPPETGKLAAARLACELVLACQGSAACRLPRRTQNVSRRGVSFVISTIRDALKEGRLGIDEVDIFLGTFNPGGLTEEAVVLDPRRIKLQTSTTWEGP